MSSFRTLCPKPNLTIFFIQISLLSYLGRKLGASSLYYSLRSKIHEITLIFNFLAVFVHFAQNETCPFFFVQITLLYYIGTKWGASGRYYSLQSKFRKITLVVNFWTVFVHFAQNETRPFFLSKLRYYIILGPNEGLLIDITLFGVSSVK